MKGVRPRTGDGVDDPSRSSPVIRRIVARQNGEFFDRVGAQIYAAGTARRPICIVVAAHSVDSIVVLLGAVTSDGQFITEAAIASGTRRPDHGLCSHTGNPGL